MWHKGEGSRKCILPLNDTILNVTEYILMFFTNHLFSCIPNNFCKCLLTYVHTEAQLYTLLIYVKPSNFYCVLQVICMKLEQSFTFSFLEFCNLTSK